MNELIYNFLNEIEDANMVKEMSVEEFIKLVKSNKLISDTDAQQLIESFKKISAKKSSADESSDTEQRNKKYRTQYKGTKQEIVDEQEKTTIVDREEDNSIER